MDKTSKYFKEHLPNEPEFDLILKKALDYINRLTEEKLAKTSRNDLFHLKTLIANACANIYVVSTRLQEIYPLRKREIDGGLVMISSTLGLLIAGVLIAISDREKEQEKYNRGTWHAEPDRNSN